MKFKSIMKTLAAAVLLLLSTFGMAAQVDVRIGNILELDDGSQLALDLSGPIAFNSFTLLNPPRLVIDIENARLNRSVNPRRQRSTDIHQVRTGKRNGRDLRVVIDMYSPADNQITLIRQNGHHLVVDLFRERNKATPGKAFKTPPIALIAKPETPAAKKQTKTSVAAQQKPRTKPRADIKPAPENRNKSKTAATSRQAAPGTRRRTIVVAIDPGHGGKDSGAVGPGGLKEKHAVLAIAKRVKKLVDQQPGMRAVLTRSNDKYLHLYQRIAIARKHKADLFVSIHADAYPDPNPRGASVYMLSTHGASSAKARWLAKKENAADYIGTVQDDAVQQVVLDIIHDGVLNDSHALAKTMLGQLGQVGKMHKTTVERANFAVLKAPDTPSVLVETAFISNPKEEAKLKSTKYQQKLAKAISRAIAKFVADRPALGEEEIQAQLAGQEKTHIIQRGETLSGIAFQYNVSLSQLISINGLDANERLVPAGMKLTIPASDG